MKTINLYLDMEFTSLSPDAQPISIGIVSDDFCSPCIDKKLYPNEDCENCSGEWHKGMTLKSFYAEFSDFDINRCDDWVKGNVIGKLKHYGQQSCGGWYASDDCFKYECYNDTDRIKVVLKEYLAQFSDYEIQIVVDCGTWDWYHFLQLVAEWDKIDNSWHYGDDFNSGLPKLPSNISPVPRDLNDLIAFKKGISVREAFNLDREWLVSDMSPNPQYGMVVPAVKLKDGIENKHNALWDAKVIKSIYKTLSTNGSNHNQ